jgi:hypothetical protein
MGIRFQELIGVSPADFDTSYETPLDRNSEQIKR